MPNQPAPPTITIRQAVAQTLPRNSNNYPTDNPSNTVSLTRKFSWNPVNGAVAPANANFSAVPSVTCPLNIIVDPATVGPSGADAIFGIGGDVRSKSANWNSTTSKVDFTPDPSLVFVFTTNFTVTRDGIDPTKGVVNATYNLTGVNQADVQSSARAIYGPGVPGGGYVQNTFVATATSGQSTTTFQIVPGP